MNKAELAMLAQRIKADVSVAEAASWFGFEYVRATGNPCPGCQAVSVSKATLALYDDATRWHCFHCDTGGDVIDWVSLRLKRRKGEVIEELAARLGIEGCDPDAVMEYLKERLTEVRHKLTSSLMADDAARQVMRCALAQHAANPKRWTLEWAKAWDRLLGMARSPSEAVRDRAVAYAPELQNAIQAPKAEPNDAHLRNAHLQRVFRDRLMSRAPSVYHEYAHRRRWLEDDCHPYQIGACAPGDGDINLFDGRVVFPIRDMCGRVTGFGGRLVVPQASTRPKAKYVNSFDSALFRKARSLFGIDLAAGAIMARGYAVIVEGYADVLACQVAGIDNAVAACGGSLSVAHAESLSLLCNEAVRMFDADDGGYDACDRATCSLSACGMKSRRAKLPDGMDPDDVLRERGVHALRLAVTGARRGRPDTRLDRAVSALRG